MSEPMNEHAAILRGLSIADYHDPASGWCSNSKLHDFVERGPAYYFGRFVVGTIEREDKSAFTFGQAWEILTQRPKDFESEVAVMPAQYKDGRSTAAKEFKAANERLGRMVISDADYQAMLAMVDSLRTHALGMARIEAAEQQVTLRGMIHGVKIQARPDWVCFRDFGCYSVDLKSTKNMNDLFPRGFAVYRFGYHVQAAIVRALLVQNGFEAPSTYLFCAEKQPAYRREFIDLTERELADGDAYLAEWLPQLARCMETNTWPLGRDEVVTLQKPRWAKDEPPMEAQP